jgi:uncharacterized protein
MNNIKKITENLIDYKIMVRINYNQQTLSSVHSIINDLSFADPHKVEFSMQRIWQVDQNEIIWDDMFDFISYTLEKGYIIYFIPLKQNVCSCYADNLGEVMVNYDGNVFKCTARDFDSANADGKLLDNGFIEWNVDKLTQRLYLKLPEICVDCKLLPACPGICSQKIIEGKDKNCILPENVFIDDYIAYNFNRNVLLKKMTKHFSPPQNKILKQPIELK